MGRWQFNVREFHGHGLAPGDNTSAELTGGLPAGWLVLALIALTLAPRVAHAAVHASLVIDARSGDVLQAYHADRFAHPASLAKLMTLYLTFQRLESGKLKLDQKLSVSLHAAAQQPTKLWLRPGSTITVRSAILGITTKSANDAAVVLAENIGGSESRFVRLMNQEAQRLGMRHTIYFNASGLPNSRQWTTARDLARLAVDIIYGFPEYYHFFGVRSFRFDGRIIYGHDHLLDECAGVDGLKTGFIDSSGFNIVTSAVRDHRRLVGVVLGGDTARARDLQMIALLNRGFDTSPLATRMVARAEPPAAPGRSQETSLRLASAKLEDGVLDSRDWTIQIGGGFSSQRSVRRVLAIARRTVPSTLREGHALMVRLRGRRYRARFSNMSHEEAARACSALESRKFTCRILPHAPISRNEVADASDGASSQLARP